MLRIDAEATNIFGAVTLDDEQRSGSVVELLGDFLADLDARHSAARAELFRFGQIVIDPLARQRPGKGLATVTVAFRWGRLGFGLGRGFGRGIRFPGRVDSVDESGAGDLFGPGTVEAFEEEIESMAKLFVLAVGMSERREQRLNHPLQHERIIGKRLVEKGGRVLHPRSTSGAREKLGREPEIVARNLRPVRFGPVVARAAFGRVQVDAREDQGPVGRVDRETQ
jgi:hypothetical protein